MKTPWKLVCNPLDHRGHQNVLRPYLGCRKGSTTTWIICDYIKESSLYHKKKTPLSVDSLRVHVARWSTDNCVLQVLMLFCNFIGVMQVVQHCRHIILYHAANSSTVRRWIGFNNGSHTPRLYSPLTIVIHENHLPGYNFHCVMGPTKKSIVRSEQDTSRHIVKNRRISEVSTNRKQINTAII